jgi:hypothetical protein
MKKLVSVAMITLASSLSLLAQDELFKVLVNKGKNTVDHAKPIFTGSKIYKGQVITLSPGGYLGLIYKNGRSMELKLPGDYPVETLEKNAIASSGSLSKKYADFVMGEMTKNSQDLTANRKANMKVTGSVERGSDGGVTIISPKNSDLLASEVKLKWYKDDAASGYTVKVKDMFDEPLKTYETVDTFVTVAVADLGLKQSKSFIISVDAKSTKAKAGSTDGKLIKVLDGKKAEDLHKEIKLVKEEAGEESALSNIILASFCEQNKLYLEAIAYYERAIELEPSVEEYQFAYQNFLERQVK